MQKRIILPILLVVTIILFTPTVVSASNWWEELVKEITEEKEDNTDNSMKNSTVSKVITGNESSSVSTQTITSTNVNKVVINGKEIKNSNETVNTQKMNIKENGETLNLEYENGNLKVDKKDENGKTIEIPEETKNEIKAAFDKGNSQITIENVDTIVVNNKVFSMVSGKKEVKEDNKSMFEVEGITEEKLLGVFPVNIKKTVIVEPESGHVVKEVKAFIFNLLDLISF